MQELRKDLLAQVAVWYYEDGMDQDSIGKLIGKSRSMVSRMLNEVRKLGIIEVKIKYPLKRNNSLEEETKQRFGLKDVWLVDTEALLTPDMIKKMVIKLAGQCLSHYLVPGVKVGVGWSRTLYRIFMDFPEINIKDSTVVQMSGSISLNSSMFDGVDITRELARKIGAQHYHFPAPMVVSQLEIKDRLMRELAIKVAMEKAVDVDVAIVGIGNVFTSGSSLVDGGLVDESSLREIREHDPAGDILAWQINADGHLLDVSLNERVIGVRLEQLKRIPSVIAVSSGAGKVKPVHAAIKGGWINILVSDYETIRAVLDMEG